MQAPAKPAAAVIGLDILYDVLDHRQKSDAAVWLITRQTAAILTDHFCRSGVELVVVEGSFGDVDERAAFLDTLTPITPHIVTLSVSFERPGSWSSRSRRSGASTKSARLPTGW
jgi:hypothetical protein